MTPISAPEVVWEVRDNIMHFVSAVHILLIPTQVRVVVKNQEKLSEPLNVVWPVGHQLHSHADIVERLDAGKVVHHHWAE